MRVLERLAHLGVTSTQVQRWAVHAGLLDHVTQGPVALKIVEAYAAAPRPSIDVAHLRGACTTCGDCLVSSAVWRSLDPSARTLCRHRGYNQAAGRGLCVRCHVRATREGRLDEHPLTTIPGGYTRARTCTRCGVPQANDDGLCRDCDEFVADDPTSISFRTTHPTTQETHP